MAEITLKVENLLSFTDAAELLGVTRPTIYSLIDKQKLHPFLIGRNRYILREELDLLKKEREAEPAEVLASGESDVEKPLVLKG